MKKVISTLITITMLALNLTARSAASAEGMTVIMQIGNPIMTVNGQETGIDAEGTVPLIRNERTLVPIRAIIEAFGGNVEWNGETQTVTLTIDDDEIKLTIDGTTAYLNNAANTLDVAPAIIDDRTMLPIRFIAEGFGLDVDWDENTQKISLTIFADNSGGENEEMNTENHTRNEIGALSPEDALEYMKNTENLVIVDVAATRWYNTKHFEGAINIPIEELDSNEEDDLYKEIPSDCPVIMHCRLGMIVPGAYRRVLEFRPDIPEIAYIDDAPMFDEYNEWLASQDR